MKNYAFSGIFVVLGFIFAANLSMAADNSNPYFVENVAVNVISNSPSEARNLALKTARRDAFLILLNRIAIDSSIADRFSDDDIADTVRSEQILNEKIAGNAYSADLNITFAKDFVDHILARKTPASYNAIIKTKTFESPQLLIPVKILKRKTLIWEEGNDWALIMAKATKNTKGGAAFRIPDIDIDNMSIVNGDNLSQITATELEPLFSKYKSEVIYFVLYSYDEIENKANILIRAIDKSRKNQYKISYVNSDNLDSNEVMNKVAPKVIEYLQRIKDIKPQNDAEGFYEIEIPIAALNDWLMIKNRIESSNLIDKLNIESISRDLVRITLVYNSNADIVESFGAIGLTLVKKDEGKYLLTKFN